MVGVTSGKRSEWWWWWLELQGYYLKWLHETRVGSYATRFASKIQAARFFILIIYRPFTIILGDRDRFGIDNQSIHTGLA